MVSTPLSVVLAVFFLLLSPFIWALILHLISGVVFFGGYCCWLMSMCCAKRPDKQPVDVESGLLDV